MQGYCEGVVGRFHGRDVRFQGRLKKPVMAKRSSRSLSRSSSRPSSSQGSQHGREGILRDSPLPPAPSRSMTLTMQDTPTTSPNPSTVSSPLLAPSSLLPGYFGASDSSSHIRSASHSSSSTAIDSAPRTPADFGKEDDSHLVRIASLSRQVDSPTELDNDESAEFEKSMVTIVADGYETGQAEESQVSPSEGLHYGGDDLDNDISFNEPSTRISIALSESDMQTGIGLSLLQDFVSGEMDDDSDSVHSSTGGAPTPAAHDLQGQGSPTLSAHEKKPTPSLRSVATSDRPSVYSTASPKMSNEAALSPTSPASTPPSPRSVLSVNSVSRNSVHPSMMSTTDSDYCGEEWEGASDIYDNYRYSRYSMASRASRLSKASMHTVASNFGLEAPPPVPFDGRRPSLDSVRQNFGLGRERLNSNATASSVESVRRLPVDATSVSSSSPKEFSTPEGKRVPPPLELKSSHHGKQPMTAPSEPSSSPLLHGGFGSPLSSPTPASASFSPLSPTTLLPNLQGAASSLRQRLEMERGSRPGTPGEGLQAESHASQSKARLSTQPIVVDDDEQGLVSSQAVPGSPTTTSSQPTSPSYMSEKKRLIETTLIVANQPAPPPPYTPTSSEFDLDSPHSPPLENPHFHGPNSPPIANPYNRPAEDPPTPVPQAVPRPRNNNLTVQQSEFIRRSIFAPHPGAPKPIASPNGPSGPMYARGPQVSQHPQGGSVVQTMHMALSALGDPTRRGRITIYAKFEHDLSNSAGPVPVSFTLDPPNNIPANKLRIMTIPPATGGAGSNAAGSAADLSMPRPQFFPKESKPRPRSRSFSGFDSTALEILVPEGQRWVLIL